MKRAKNSKQVGLWTTSAPLKLLRSNFPFSAPFLARFLLEYGNVCKGSFSSEQPDKDAIIKALASSEASACHFAELDRTNYAKKDKWQMNLSTILDEIDLGGITLPEFQRGYV